MPLNAGQLRATGTRGGRWSLDLDGNRLPATWGGRKLTLKRLVNRIEKLFSRETPALDSSDALARLVFERSPNGMQS